MIQKDTNFQIGVGKNMYRYDGTSICAYFTHYLRDVFFDEILKQVKLWFTLTCPKGHHGVVEGQRPAHLISSTLPTLYIHTCTAHSLITIFGIIFQNLVFTSKEECLTLSGGTHYYQYRCWDVNFIINLILRPHVLYYTCQRYTSTCSIQCTFWTT